MRRMWTVLVLLAGVATAQNGRTLEVVPEAGELKGETLYANSHALIIGVNRYPHLPPERQLECAEKDATELREMLISRYAFPAENVRLLLSKDATRQGIEDALIGLTSNRRVGKQDRVIIFFSGHGNAVTLANGSKLGFLIPSDAKVDLKNPNAADYLSTCVSMKSLWEKLEACPAKHVLLMADACFSGLLVRGRSPGGVDLSLSARAIREWLARPAIQVLTASGREQESKEDPSKGHGFFTLKLLEELSAKAANPGDAFPVALLAARLQVSVPNLAPGQLPQFDNYGGTEGQFVLVPTRPVPVPLVSGAGTTTTNVPAEPPARLTNPKDGAVLVYIPSGEFLMGIDREEIDRAGQRFGWPEEWKKLAVDESPARRVKLTRGFYLYETEVTNEMYRRFVSETGHREPQFDLDGNGFKAVWADPRFNGPKQPVVGVSYEDALAYCRWAGAGLPTGTPLGLPTEAQWEYAARGDAAGVNGKPHHFFVWGSDLPRNGDRVGNLAEQAAKRALNLTSVFTGYDDGFGFTAPVRQFRPNSHGLYDMAGNAWEWCADEYAENYYPTRPNPDMDPAGPRSGKADAPQVMRGGAWFSGPDAVRASRREAAAPGDRDLDVGFRPARTE